MGGDRADYNNIRRYLPDLLSLAPSPIKVRALEKPKSSDAIIRSCLDEGMVVDFVPARLYSPSRYGQARSLTNKEVTQDYALYFPDMKVSQEQGAVDESIKRFVKVRDTTGEIRTDMFKWYESKGYATLAEMEWEDCRKFSQQRGIFPGAHLETHLKPEQIHMKVPGSTFDAITRVLRVYARKATYSQKSWSNGMFDGIDTPGTAPGAPLFTSGGDNFLDYRLKAMAVLPNPLKSKLGGDYFNELIHSASKYLPDPYMIILAYLSYRTGMTDKFLPLWLMEQGGYTALDEAQYLHCRARHVYPYGHFLNVIKTALVQWLKSARMNTEDLWQTPEKRLSRIPKLEKQGEFNAEGDFSSFDTSQNWQLNYHFYDTLEKMGIYPWICQLFKSIVCESGVIYPSYQGDLNEVTIIRKYAPTLSGELDTGEKGTVFAVASHLDTLERQIPGTFEAWERGEFLLPDQGDDVRLVTPKELDPDKYRADMQENWGFDIKIKPKGTTFLKMAEAPVAGVKAPMAKLQGRVVCQDVFNEDSTSGKPVGVIALGACDRRQLSQNHEMFVSGKSMTYWEAYFSHTDFPWDDYKDKWARADWTVTPKHNEEVLKYATDKGEGSNWVLNQLALVNSKPGAAQMIASLVAMGVPVDSMAQSAIEYRSHYVKKLCSDPDPAEVTDILTNPDYFKFAR